MELKLIKEAIERVRPHLNGKAAVWLDPDIPEEIIEQHKKIYLDLNPDEKPLIVVNRKQMLFTGLCITNQRLILRLESKIGIGSTMSRKTIEFTLESIQSLSCLQNMDGSIRILVNNKNLGYIYPIRAGKITGFKDAYTDDFNNSYYAFIESLFNELSGVSVESTDAVAKETQAEPVDNVDEVKPATAPVEPSFVVKPREVKHSKIAGLISTYFIDTIKSHYVDFKGKATRSDFWYFALCQFLILSGISGICQLLFGGGLIVYYILSLALCLPVLAVTVRRLHDIGKRGWMLLIVMIPLIGAVWLIVLLCKKGETTPRRHNVLPVDYIILLISAVFGFLWYEQMANDSFDYISDATEYNYSANTEKSKPTKKIKGKWFPINEAAAVPDYDLNRLFAVGSNDKKDLDSDGLGYYGEPAIIYTELNGKKDIKWNALLLFSDISEAYQEMGMYLIPASFNSNVLYFNYHFNGEDNYGHSGKVDVTTGKFDLFEGRIMGMITEGSYEDMYLKDMGSYWGLYQQSGIGESGAPLAKLNPYDFRSMTSDDVISWIEGQ